MRRVHTPADGPRSRDRLRILLDEARRAPVPAVRTLRASAHSSSLSMVRSPATVRSRGALRVLGARWQRRRDRPRAQVRWLAGDSRRHGRSNGACRLADRCRAGAHSARTSAAVERTSARARVQPERATRPCARLTMAHTGLDRCRRSVEEHRNADASRLERPLAQRGWGIRCFSVRVESPARCASRARGRRGHDGRDVERVRRIARAGRRTNNQLRHFRPRSLRE